MVPPFLCGAVLTAGILVRDVILAGHFSNATIIVFCAFVDSGSELGFVGFTSDSESCGFLVVFLLFHK